MDHGDLFGKHIARLERDISSALNAANFDAVVFHAGTEVLRSRFDDQHWPFRPTPGYAHLSPIAEPNAAVVIGSEHGAKLYRPTFDSFWESAPPEPASWMLSPFEETSPDAQRPARTAFVGDDPKAAAEWGITAEAINPEALLSELDAIRAHKSAYEVECLAEANRLGARGHAAVIEAFIRGECSEFELNLHYLVATEQSSTDTPYQNIVALNRNAAVLHHIRLGRERMSSERANSLLIDAGAMVNGYGSDITRTHLRNRNDDGAADFADLIHAMDALQQEICDRLEPGLSFELLHDQTHELLAEAVVALEIATASTEELIATGVTRALLPHGLGHSLGIQVHDVGCRIKPPAERNPFLRNTADVAVGQVFTVEPGCYFIESLLEPLRGADVGKRLNWPKIASLGRFGGVRIEDNVYIAENETRNLTRDNWPGSP